MVFESEADVFLLKRGDKKAFERIYRRYIGKVYNFTSLYLSDSDVRNDVVQAVFIRLWDKRHLLDEKRNLDGFLFIITRNLILDYFSKSSKSIRMDSMRDMQIVTNNYLDEKIDSEIVMKSLSSLINMLPQRQREAFILRRDEGLSIKEIAMKMGISESGVKRNLNLAFRFIKNNLPMFVLFM